jgi:CRP/FNR family transcriptional regulator
MTKGLILQAFDFYLAASAEERHGLAEAANDAHLPEGALFYREGELCDYFALVGRGDLRVFRTGPDGREITLYHVRDRQPCLVNMLSVFLGRPAMASAIADAPTDAVVVPAPVFRHLIATSDVTRRFVFETMAARLVDVMTLVEEISVRRMDARLAALLLRTFALRASDNVIASTHDELAAELGTVREVVSRVLKEFERTGAIRLGRSRITLVDQHVLPKLPETPGRPDAL